MFCSLTASSLPTKKFIDPEISSVPFPEIAQQNVTSLLKNESKKIAFCTQNSFSLNLVIFSGNWILKNNVGNIGWRARKQYFKVNQKTHSSQKHSQSSKLESQPSTSSYKEQTDQEFLLSWTVSWCNFESLRRNFYFFVQSFRSLDLTNKSAIRK